MAGLVSLVNLLSILLALSLRRYCLYYLSVGPSPLQNPATSLDPFNSFLTRPPAPKMQQSKRVKYDSRGEKAGVGSSVSAGAKTSGDGSLKDFAPGLWDSVTEVPSRGTLFKDQHIGVKAVVLQKEYTDDEWDAHVEKWCKILQGWRQQIDESGEDEVGMPEHVKVVLKSTNVPTGCSCNNNESCPKCENSATKGFDYVPNSRSPGFIAKLVNEFGLPDKLLSEHVKFGFPMKDCDSGNWQKQVFSDREWGIKQIAKLEKAEKGSQRYPPRPKRVNAEDLPKFLALQEGIAKDTNRGRYEEVSAAEFKRIFDKAPEDDKPILVLINPIDQSCRREDGSWKTKYRWIWDGRRPNAGYYSQFGPNEKVRIEGRTSFAEFAALCAADDVMRQMKMSQIQKKKDVHADMQNEIRRRRDYEAKNSSYKEYRKNFKKDMEEKTGIVVDCPENSIEELVHVVKMAQELLESENNALEQISIVDKFGTVLAVGTRDYSEAYYQYAVSSPHLNHFFWFSVDVSDQKVDSEGVVSFGGEWKYGRSRVLNMGALPAICGEMKLLFHW